MIGKIFQIYGVQITGKEMHLPVKYLLCPTGKTLSTQTERNKEIIHPLISTIFLETRFTTPTPHPQQKAGQETLCTQSVY